MMTERKVVVDGREYILKSLEIISPKPLPRPPIAKGSFNVSGTITCFFEDPKVLEAFVVKPHKVTVWHLIKRHAVRAVLLTLFYVAVILWLTVGFAQAVY